MKLFIITIFLLLNINLDSQEDPCGLFGTDDYHLSGYSWDNPNLKYYFRNFTSDLTEEQIRQVFTDAFNKWANVTGLAFTETLDQNEADITIRWHTEGSFYNNNAIFALTYYPTPFHENSGDMEFNENITWKVQRVGDGSSDLRYVALHEIGHVLGLCHSGNSSAVMYYPFSHKLGLIQADINGITSIYIKIKAKNEFMNPDGSISNGGIVNVENQDYYTDGEPNNEKTITFNNGSQRRFEAKEQNFQSIERKFNPYVQHNGGWFFNDGFENVRIGTSEIINTNVSKGLFKAIYLYKTNISLIANTEFNGVVPTGLTIGQIFQYEDGLINAPSSYQPSGSNINYKFSYWSDNFEGLNPRSINPIENETYTALYKYPHHSNTGSFANSGQRKVIKCDYGYLHLVYESMGYVWYERSTDNGASWHIMNGGKPIDKNPSKSPSIDFYYGYQRLIIVYQTWAGDNNEFAAIKAACFKLGELEFTTTVEQSYLSTYSEVNYKPVVGYASNDKIAVAWEDYGVWVKTGVLSFSTNQVTWNNIVGVDNNNTANINPTIAAYKTTPGTATFHLAWQNNYSTIRYCNLTEQSKGSFLVSAVDQVSQGCGFPVNYYPSINVSNSNNVQLVWIGTPHYGSSYRKALSRSRTTGWSSSFTQYGNNILSLDVAFYTGSSVVSWSENPSGNTYTNKFIKYGSVRTAGTTGKDVRIFNASTLQDMHLVSFTTNSLPYAFTHSANLNSINKDNALVMASGVQAVAFKDGVEYFFRIGDINFNGSNIDFESFEDTVGVLSLEDLNTNLITNSFTANENNSLVYSIEYGVTDSVLALVRLQNKFISFRVELIDQLTGVVLAELNNIQMDGNNVEKLKTATFNFNITGLPNSSLVIRLKVNNNLEPQYAAAVIKSDESVLLKNNPVELNLSGTAVITEYSLEQNFPNPFNPSTIIKFQIPKDGFVSLKVYDILGNEITNLVNEEKSRGRYEVNFNGSSLANGVYIYKIQSGDFISSKKMILLK